MKINFIAIFISTFIPLLIGFTYYHPKTFGNAWMKEADMNEEKMKSRSMGLIFALTLVFSFFLSIALQYIVIHQWHLYSIFANDPSMSDPNSEIGKILKDFMDKYGNNFRTFKHGAFHGIIAAIFLVLPIIGINALFERKSAKYVALHTGYWAISLALMGGVLCAMV
jgi:hypothetical protein